MLKLRHCLILLLAVATPTLQQQTDNFEEEEFHEELYVKPLPSGHVNTYFQFTTRWHYGDASNLHNTHLVPRPIAEILLHFDVKELHVSLTQGLWRYETWGYPVVDTAPGAEVWAWFSSQHNLTSEDVDRQWLKLAGTFSGILCSSLNFIDGTNSLAPKYGFRPRFGSKNDKSEKHLRYATLPREIVCTENLTPWKKLLPCNSKEGFASLLNSGHVHNTNFHALSISLRTICSGANNTNCLLEFTESANLVYDPKIMGSNDFSLRRMFGQGLNGYCALAKSSKLYVSLDDNRYELTPTPATTFSSTRGGATTHFGVYDMQDKEQQLSEQLFNVAWVQRKNQPAIDIMQQPPPIYAHRYIVGQGQERGQLVTEITNTHYAAVPVILQENIPWFVPVYMHTLKLNARNSEQSTWREIKPQAVHYVPGVQRVRPYHLELAFELPPLSTVQLSFDFDYIFLKWLEYPPDANHGHYLGSAVISTQLQVARNYTAIPVEGSLFAHSFNASRNAYFLTIRTESLILSLPTPDFSMPYNVICLACTVVALAFGPIHSVATKKIVIETKDEPHTMLGRLKHKLFGKRKPKDEAPLLKDADCDVDADDANGISAEMHEKSE